MEARLDALRAGEPGPKTRRVTVSASRLRAHPQPVARTPSAARRTNYHNERSNIMPIEITHSAAEGTGVQHPEHIFRRRPVCLNE